MKKLIILCLIIFLFADVYALRINEVEVNPLGDERILKNEWVEFYNDGEISLEGYIIINNDGESLNLNGSFNGYYIYALTKQWLDNSDESVSLYNGSELIDKTDLFEDSKDNDKTYQFCDGEWRFLDTTKGEENNCEIIEEKQEPEEQPENQTEDNSGEGKYEEENNTKEGAKTNILTLETIELNPDSENIENEGGKEVLKRNLAFAGIVTFCVVFGGAVFLLNIKKRKRELV